ncbi:MAG: hypothetical protein GKR95_00705 [Gammaproteobacteria bacterium]|nr:hypothetical protein [Gammaproteobacteria bacterium]
MTELEEKILRLATELQPNLTEMGPDVLTAGIVEEGLLDSFQLIGFIASIEKAFDVVLTLDLIMSREFSNLDGIVQIVERLTEAKNET